MNIIFLNMKASYTNLLNLYNSRLILLLTIFTISGCQINQSVNIIKEQIFSDSEDNILETNTLEKVEIKNNEIDTEKSNQGKNPEKVFSKEPKSETSDLLNERMSSPNQDLAFKELGKARDTDSKIISFFTKIFNDKEVVDQENFEKESSQIKNDKKKDSLTKQEEVDEKTIGMNDEDESFFTNQNESKEEELSEEFANEDMSDEEEELEEVDEKSKKTNDKFSFLNIKPPKLKERKAKRDNLVGLLLPLTGEKSAAGNLVVNSLRYSTLLKPNQLNFKIFDTKGTPKGAVSAAKEGLTNGVKTFIGPIFSDETREVKDFFKNRKNLTFFSLSPDLNNVSDNVIVSGQNPDDQISCIVKHIIEVNNEKILLIYHADKYGYVIRNSFSKYSSYFGAKEPNFVEYFEVEQNINLNDEIRKISRFKERKVRLKNEIDKIKDNENLEDAFKKRQIKLLERKLTLDSPFDSIIIASEGDKLLEILSHLAFYDINSENTNIYGTSLWEDSEKKDSAFKGAIYASSLKEKKGEFTQSFKNIFSRDPMSFNFHMHDLLDLVQNYKIMEDGEKEKIVFYGEFSNSKIEAGLLQREIFLKKIKNNKRTEEVFNCRLNVI